MQRDYSYYFFYYIWKWIHKYVCVYIKLPQIAILHPVCCLNLKSNFGIQLEFKKQSDSILNAAHPWCSDHCL